MNCFEELKNKNGQEYIDLVNLIVKKSKFDVDNLGNYVAHFLSLFYGEEFVYVTGYSNIKDFLIVYKFVAKKKDKVEFLTIQNVNRLYYDDDVTILGVYKNNTKKKCVNLYDFEDNELLENGKFTGIAKEFINNLINIKVQGGVCNPETVINTEYKLFNKYLKNDINNEKVLKLRKN